MNNVQLNFKIDIYEYGDWSSPIKTDIFSKEYSDNKTLEDVLKDLSKKYKTQLEYDLIRYNNLGILLWGQYFDNEISCFLNDDELLLTSLYKLESQFNISTITLNVVINGGGIGGGVGSEKGLHFYFHTREKDVHKIPHIHVSYSGETISVNLETLQLFTKPFKNKKKTKDALQIIKKHQGQLINYWNKVVNKGESIKFNMFILDEIYEELLKNN